MDWTKEIQVAFKSADERCSPCFRDQSELFVARFYVNNAPVAQYPNWAFDRRRGMLRRFKWTLLEYVRSESWSGSTLLGSRNFAGRKSKRESQSESKLEVAKRLCICAVLFSLAHIGIST